MSSFKDNMSDLITFCKTPGTSNRGLFIGIAILYFIGTPVAIIGTIITAITKSGLLFAAIGLVLVLVLDVVSYILLTKEG